MLENIQIMKTVSAEKNYLINQFEECTENIDEVKSAGAALFERRNKCKSLCTIYIVLIAIVFTIGIGDGTQFIYYKYMNHDKKKLLLNTIMYIKHPIINIKWEMLKK